MILLKECSYNKVVEPLKRVTINKLFAIVVVERMVSGKVYVDNVETPTTFYIVHPYGMSLLFGHSENMAFNEALSDYLTNRGGMRDKIEWLQVFPADPWNKKLELILGENLIKKNSLMDFSTENDTHGSVIENTRVNFVFDLDKYKKIKRQLTYNASYKLVRIDEMIYEKSEGCVVPKYFWNNARQFLENGIGFCLLCDVNGLDIIASIAYSSFIVGEKLEIGVETKVEFRGRNFALIVCLCLINYCLENGFEPVWACRLENVASYKLAQRLGFKPEKYLSYYKLNGEHQDK